MGAIPEILDRDWFARLQTMELDEAELLCKDALNVFKERIQPGQINQQLQNTIARLNVENHRIAQLKQKTDLYAAIRALWGQDGIDQVREWRAVERAKLMRVEKA